MPPYKALDYGQNARNKVKIGQKKRVSCHFQLSLKVDRSSFEFCLKVDNKAKF